jgi:hypothetical protein
VTTGPHDPRGPEVPVPRGPPPEEPRKTSGFAIASFVLGLIGGVFLSVIFGIVALRRIRRRNLKGRGLAIAGLALSGVWVLVIAVGVTVALLTDAERDSSGRIQETGSESVFDLRVGDCMNDIEETDAELSVEVTPCEEPHDAEVISTFGLADGDYPGESFIFRAADPRCARGLDALAPPAGGAAEPEPFYYFPTKESWALDDRRITCVALLPEPQRGSLERR